MFAWFSHFVVNIWSGSVISNLQTQLNLILGSLVKRTSRPEVFCRKSVLRNLAKFTGKHLCQSFFFNKVAGLRSATLSKKRLWHRCFHVNFAKFLRTPCLIEHLRWLLLSKVLSVSLFSFSLNVNIYNAIAKRLPRKKRYTRLQITITKFMFV